MHENPEVALQTPPSGQVTVSGKAIASLVLGVLTLVLWLLAGVPAIVLGVLALRDIAKSNGRLSGTGQAIAGMCIGTIVSGVILVAAVFLPVSSYAENGAKEANRTSQLKRIAISVANYHAAVGHLPSNIHAIRAGEPRRSWRTELLPYFSSEKVFEAAVSYDSELPWDDAANRAASDSRLEFFRSSFQPSPVAPTTNYLGVVGDGFVMNDKTPTTIGQVTDGTDRTIFCVEYIPSRIRWAEPKDLTFDEYAAYVADPQNQPNDKGFMVLFVNGSVGRLRPGIPKEQLRALFTFNGKETIDPVMFK